MARGYPRFLYSNPQNTKSEGPFIVHTLYPKAVFRIFSSTIHVLQPGPSMHGKYFSVVLLDIDECNDETKMPLVSEAYDWFKYQKEAEFFK